MKKALLLLCLLASTLTAAAQFEQGKKYISTSFSGLGLSYSGSEKFRLGVNAKAGYFVADCLLLHGDVNYNHTRSIDDVSVGAGARYYFDQCGIYMGAGAQYVHYTPNSNDVQIPLEVGYAFFVNRFITIEPSLYYKMSLHDFSDNSTFGFNIGIGFFF